MKNRTNKIHKIEFVNQIQQSYILLTVVANESYWIGGLVFDQPRHQTYFNMPVDYPRINSISEWFTVDVDKEYRLIELDNVGGKNKKIVKGAELINDSQ